MSHMVAERAELIFHPGLVRQFGISPQLLDFPDQAPPKKSAFEILEKEEVKVRLTQLSCLYILSSHMHHPPVLLPNRLTTHLSARQYLVQH